jgi:hypothetical protein
MEWLTEEYSSPPPQIPGNCAALSFPRHSAAGKAVGGK